MRAPMLMLCLVAVCAKQAPPEPPLDYDGPGVAAQWAEWTSRSLAPEGFPERLDAVLASCEVGFEVVEVDCSEPPCLAVARVADVHWKEQLLRCPAWTDPFGVELESVFAYADCGDGRQETVGLVGSSKTWQWTADPAPSDPENRQRRLRFRRELVLEDWRCADAGAVRAEVALEPFEQGVGYAPVWGVGTPRELGEYGFEEAMDAAIGRCRPGVDLLGVDCGEPPCLAWLELQRPDWRSRLVDRCEAFQKSFGDRVSLSTDTIECPDGPRRIGLLGSERTWDFVAEPPDPDGWNAAKRQRVRMARAKAAIGCD